MTVIIGAARGGRVILGSDSLTLAGADKAIRTTPKVFRLGPLLIGVAGSPRVSDVLRYAGIPPFMDLDEDPHRQMVMAFVPWLRNIAGENGVLMSYEGQDVLQGHSNVLIGYRQEVFSVAYDFSTVTYACGYAAIGSAAPYALGAMHAVWNDAVCELEATVEAGLRAATAPCADVQAPFAYLELDV